MATSFLLSSARRCLLLPKLPVSGVPARNLRTSSVLFSKVKSGTKLAKECEERTQFGLIDARNVKKLYTPPKFAKNISELFKFFPLSPDIVESTLMDHPEILSYDAAKVIEFIQILVEGGDYDVIKQEEALLFVARCPEILKFNKLKFAEQVSDIFGLTANYDLPWNIIIIASPHTLALNPDHIGYIVELLTKYFTAEKIRDVVGSNPEIFEMIWDDIEEKILYLQKTMNVSSHRIAMTPHSLTHSLSGLQLRYQFLLRSGHYRHPDPSAMSAVPVEASPALHLITDTDEERFVHKCCPGLSMEEFNIFKAIIMLETTDTVEDEFETLEDYNDDDIEDNSYTRKTKEKNKQKNKKRVVRAKS
eukprot:GFUD01010289.1.p1 GENE.GFUD01010289.1~~GFUD01010289.1.p1  ORF type:complete len:362 (+),score=81.48 GFUD01010289.1:38-1123(+)